MLQPNIRHTPNSKYSVCWTIMRKYYAATYSETYKNKN